MNFVARLAFGLLVVATFSAFFVAQRLKAAPSLVQDVTARPVFSPNQDGRKERARWSFLLKRDDELTASVVDADGDEVVRLIDGRDVPAYDRVEVEWDGRDNERAMVPDGMYRLRLGLREQGRAITLTRSAQKDTAPPRPKVLSIGPEKDTAPEIIPRADGDPAEVRVAVAGDRRELEVWRTDVRPARRVLGPVDLPDGPQQQTWRWDGADADGEAMPAGTYLVVARSRDQAGNIGESVAGLPPDPPYGEPLPGRGGIRVRYLSAQAPTAPVAAGKPMRGAVASPGGEFTWSVRRAGSGERRVGPERRTRSQIVRLRAPGGESGLYIFEARRGDEGARAPFLVQGERSRSVLVVLPATTWQGRNRVDDGGDGWPDTLGGGRPVETARPYADAELPDDLRDLGAPLLIHLDGEGRRYDLTTDIALGRGQGPRLAGHSGVILAGEFRWLSDEVQRGLRRLAEREGTVMVTGPDSLRRSVRLTAERLLEPRPPADRTLFGLRLGPLERVPGMPTTLIALDDEIELFAGTEGRFTGVEAFEPVVDAAGGTEVVAAAVTEGTQRRVLVGARVGRGLVVHTGLPNLPARLDEDPELAAFMERAWTLLAR
ncbi:MAG TPA: N,N-dimethylformamidase beta subunit family domain-containing protein [Solirubrobacteraceae bacterium]|nr:N,N-dimethylformamidase beta subunit family domain-containing protein [Solirubrobacteraceae bacterium]